MIKPALLCLVTLLSMVSACQNNDSPTVTPAENSDNSNQTISQIVDHLEVGNAYGFVITDVAGTMQNAVSDDYVSDPKQSITEPSNVLYKVTENGSLEEVVIENSDGDSLNGLISPVSVQEINENYVLMYFKVQPDYNPHGYLVSKKTGQAYKSTIEYDSTYDPSNPVIVNEHQFLSDSAGNIYYADTIGSGDGDIRRINAESFGAATLEDKQIKVTEDSYTQWTVADSGDFVAYNGYEYARTINIKSGAIANLNTLVSGKVFTGGASAIHPLDFVKGLDGKVYGVGYNPTNFSEPVVYRFAMNTSGIMSAESVGALQIIDSNSTFSNASYSRADLLGNDHLWPTLEGASSTRFVSGGKIYYWAGVIRDAKLIEVDPAKARVRIVNSVSGSFSRIKNIFATDDYYFVYGTEVATSSAAIYRVNPRTDETLRFNITDNYDLEDVKVLSTNKVRFKALRLADATDVVGEVNLDGNIEILDVFTRVPDVYIMVPIQPADFIVIDGSTADWNSNLLRFTDTSSDSTGNSSADILKISSTTTSDMLYLLITVADDLNSLQNQEDIQAVVDEQDPVTFTPEVRFYFTFTESDTAFSIGASGVSGIDVVTSVIGGKAIELQLPLANISYTSSLKLSISTAWLNKEGTIVRVYDTADAVSIPLP